MRRAARIFLVLSFALLQCVSPLAHAHVGGHDAGTRVHLGEVERQADSLEALAAVEPSEMPVIYVPDGKQRNYSQHAWNQPALCGSCAPCAIEDSAPAHIAAIAERPALPQLFRTQNPQAPPALAL